MKLLYTNVDNRTEFAILDSEGSCITWFPGAHCTWASLHHLRSIINSMGYELVSPRDDKKKSDDEEDEIVGLAEYEIPLFDFGH